MGDSADAARRMVRAARSTAIQSYTILLKEYPQLEWIGLANKLRDWDILMAISGVGAALFVSKDHFTDAEQEALSQVIVHEVQGIHPRGHDLLWDLMTFIGKNADNGISPPDAIGMWLLVNLKGDWPNVEESQPARPLGIFLLNAFQGWW